MKEMYEKLWLDLFNLQDSNFTNYKMFAGIPMNTSITIKSMRSSIKTDYQQSNFEGQWKYIALLRYFYLAIKRNPNKYDWSSKRPGTFFTKSMNLLRFEDSCKSSIITMEKLIAKLLTIKKGETGIPLIKLIYLYSIDDFQMLIKNTTKPTRAPPSLLDVDLNFRKYVSSMLQT